ncbi:hypothetical protein AGLY_007419 [Aphis glycines]|uniref:Uncharacterized protein n=1 Tax=Aphis glycines TaxID=307491 RepID=A0A6G0TPG2_APHGL|nr:hypothetical protein AGLY_007419 [Aphis glycines]
MKRFLIKSTNLSVNTPVKKVRNTLSLECGHMDEDDPIPSTSFTAVQHENKNTSTESAGYEELSKTSYLFDGELYTIVSVDGIKISAICTACSKLKHNFMMSKVQAKKDAKKKSANELSTSNLFEKKQSKLSFNQSEKSKEEVKNLIFNYIVEEMKPLITCEKPSFKRLIQGLTSKNIVISHRRVIAKEFKVRYKYYVKMLTELIENQNFICLTSDIWSSNNRSYLGMTCHYINETNCNRHSYVLACKRIKGSHTHLNISKVIT